MKHISIPTLEYYRDKLDAGSDFQNQARIQQYISGSISTSKLAIAEHGKHKLVWDKELIKGGDDVRWTSFEFEDSLPVATSGAFYPEYDFSGTRLQALDAPLYRLALTTFSIVAINGATHAIFAWLDDKPQVKRLVKSLEKIEPRLLASAIIQFSFDTSDNLFVRPSWWNELHDDPKANLSKLLRHSMPGTKNPHGLCPILEGLFESKLKSVHIGHQ